MTELSLDAFAQRLASADPTPGGGSASAYVGALSAALVRMVAQLTSASPKHAHVAGEAKRAAADARSLMDELVACVDIDAVAFEAVTAAYRLPKSSESEKVARSAAIQKSLAGATEPPMRVIDITKEVCTIAGKLADFGNPSAVSDVGCAVLCAQAAAQGAALNVFINARSLKDRVLASDLAGRARESLSRVDLLAEVVLGKVRAQIG